jgi:hypothetical protein
MLLNKTPKERIKRKKVSELEVGIEGADEKDSHKGMCHYLKVWNTSVVQGLLREEALLIHRMNRKYCNYLLSLNKCRQLKLHIITELYKKYR